MSGYMKKQLSIFLCIMLLCNMLLLAVASDVYIDSINLNSTGGEDESEHIAELNMDSVTDIAKNKAARISFFTLVFFIVFSPCSSIDSIIANGKSPHKPRGGIKFSEILPEYFPGGILKEKQEGSL